MHGNSSIVILLLLYPIVLVGLLISAIALEFNKSRRYLSIYFVAAAIGSILGFILGCILGGSLELLIEEHGLTARNQLMQAGLVDYFLYFAPLGTAVTSTLMFGIACVYLVVLRQRRKRILKQPSIRF